MEKFSIHVCMVSAQAAPNLVPVLAKEFKPAEVVLLVTSAMTKAADALEKVYRKYQVKVQRLVIEQEYNITAMEEQLLSFLGQHESKQMALNITGGTKTMAIAALNAFSAAGKPVFYIRPDNNEIQIIQPKGCKPFTPEVSLKLEDFLAAHGYQVTSLERRVSEYAEHLTEQLITRIGQLEKALGELNYLAAKCEENERRERKPKLTCELEREVEGLDKLLTLCEGEGLLSRLGKKITFRDVDARRYLNGGWLEQHAFHIARKLKNTQDVAMNVKVRHDAKQGSAENELDIVLLANNRLFIVECKTRNFQHGTHGTEALYKLDSLLALGGVNTKGMLISYRSLSEAIKGRAKDLKIKTVETHQLGTLTNNLHTWITSRG